MRKAVGEGRAVVEDPLLGALAVGDRGTEGVVVRPEVERVVLDRREAGVGTTDAVAATLCASAAGPKDEGVGRSCLSAGWDPPAGTIRADRGTTPRCAAPFGTGATLTAAVTGLPRAVLLRSRARFFRVLPGDGRIGACASSLREPRAARCGVCAAVERPRNPDAGAVSSGVVDAQRRRQKGRTRPRLTPRRAQARRGQQLSGERMPRGGETHDTVPESTTRPSFITITSSAMPATTSRSCVTNTIARSRSACRARRRSRIRAAPTRRAPTRLVEHERSGVTARARAIATRWRCPPEALRGSAPDERGRQAHLFEQGGDGGATRRTCDSPGGHGLGERAADRPPGSRAPHGSAARAARGSARRRGRPRTTRGGPRTSWSRHPDPSPDDQAREGRLARPRLPHDREGPTAAHLDRHVVDRRTVAEALGQGVGGEDGGVGARCRRRGSCDTASTSARV